MRKCANISPNMTLQLLHSEISLNTCMYEENLIFFFIRVERLQFMLLLKVGTREAVSPCMIYVFYPVFYPHNSA
jgi:hypothetical protein